MRDTFSEGGCYKVRALLEHSKHPLSIVDFFARILTIYINTLVIMGFHIKHVDLNDNFNNYKYILKSDCFGVSCTQNTVNDSFVGGLIIIFLQWVI